MAQEAVEEPEEQSEPVLLRRTYDISRLMHKVPHFHPRHAVETLAKLMGIPLSDEARTPFTSSGAWYPDHDSDDDSRRLRELIDLIHILTLSEPGFEPWDSYGGRARLQFHDERLMVVTQTEVGHKHLAEILADLEAAAVARPSIAVRLMVVEFNEDYQRQLLMTPARPATSDKDRQQLIAAISKVHRLVELTGRSGQQISNFSGVGAGFVAESRLLAKDADVHISVPGVSFSGLHCSILADIDVASQWADVGFQIALTRLLQLQSPDGDSTDDSFGKPTTAGDIRAGNIRLALDTPTIIGGSTVPAFLFDTSASDTDTRQVYYILMISRIDPPPPPRDAAAEAPSGD